MNQYTVYLPIVSNQKPGFKDLFGRYGIQFGFAVAPSSFINTTTRRLIEQHANICTPEVHLKMEYTQPEENDWDFTEMDRIVAYAKALDIDVHGHTLSWYMQNPAWLTAGEFTRDQLAEILRKHVRTVSFRYRNDMVSFDAANEAWINPDGSVYGGVWQPLGDNYVDISFNCALAKTMPMYNSFYPHPGMEYPKVLKWIDDEQCDGIGIQLHLWDGSYKTTLGHTELFLAEIRKRHSWCRFSEISVLAANDNEQSQAAVYAAITKLAIKYSDVVKGFIVWGVKDPCWRGNGLLFDRDGKPKPSYHAIIDELKK